MYFIESKKFAKTLTDTDSIEPLLKEKFLKGLLNFFILSRIKKFYIFSN